MKSRIPSHVLAALASLVTFPTTSLAVPASVLKDKTEMVDIPVDAAHLSCFASSHFNGFKNDWITTAAVSLKLDAPLPNTVLAHREPLTGLKSWDGRIDLTVACASVPKILEIAQKQNGMIKGKLRVELVRQDWAPDPRKGRVVFLIEQFRLELPGLPDFSTATHLNLGPDPRPE